MTDVSDLRHPVLRVADAIALGAVAVVALAATAVAVTESYRNLYEFAILRGWGGWQAWIAPLQVDTFIVAGELLLFLALARAWDLPAQALGWGLALAGFAVSLAGNVGHVSAAGWQSRAMYALAPVAATAGLAAGLMILKRVVADYKSRLLEGAEADRVALDKAKTERDLLLARAEADRIALERLTAERQAAAPLTKTAPPVLREPRGKPQEARESELAARLSKIPPGNLPSERDLAASDLDGSRRAAARVLGQVRAQHAQSQAQQGVVSLMERNHG